MPAGGRRSQFMPTALITDRCAPMSAFRLEVMSSGCATNVFQALQAASRRTEKYYIRTESSMNQVQVGQKGYQMPPQDGFTVAHFLTVADIERSARFYETVFGGRILSKGPPGYIQIANTWLIVNVGGGPTPDKPSVTLRVPADPNSVSSFMNIRVADIQACYELWRNRGAGFITEPQEQYGETCCYIRDPDGYLIEVGQSKPGFAYG
jgi:predicted enzyme related to lactoylglutathione lyase